jgi:phosphatidate phosphatase APP1
VLLEPAVGTVNAVLISGRVLKNAPSAGHSIATRNLRRFTASNWEGVSVQVRLGEVSAQVTTGSDGDFEVNLEAPKGQPFDPGLTTVEASVPGAVSTASVDLLPLAAPFFVISDLDDTLSVTNVVKTASMIRAAFWQDEKTQPVVKGMPEFYQCLKAGGVPRPAFMLVSGSPIQYLDRVRLFLARNGFPVFGIALRDIGPSTLSNYKQPVIRKLLASIPNQVVLVGDSGEHDPEVYAQMRAEFPGRVAAVYIRNAGHAEDKARFKDMLLFEHPAQAAVDAVKRGLADGACVNSAFAGNELQ